MKNDKEYAINQLERRLLDIEEEQRSGAATYSIDELDSTLRKIVYNK